MGARNPIFSERTDYFRMFLLLVAMGSLPWLLFGVSALYNTAVPVIVGAIAELIIDRDWPLRIKAAIILGVICYVLGGWVSVAFLIAAMAVVNHYEVEERDSAK